MLCFTIVVITSVCVLLSAPILISAEGEERRNTVNTGYQEFRYLYIIPDIMTIANHAKCKPIHEGKSLLDDNSSI